MTGWIRYVRGKGRDGGEVAGVCGVTLYSLTLYEPEGLGERKLERRLERLERTLRKAGVSRVILPPDFPYRAWLRQVQPVEVLSFYRGAADLLTLGWLECRGIPAVRASVALAGPRVCPELRGAALGLCPRVRALRINVPGREGTAFAEGLQRSCGVPVLPPNAPADVAVSFGPTELEAELRLWGSMPDFGGLKLTAPGLNLPEELEQPLLALLWERGSLRREDVLVKSIT